MLHREQQFTKEYIDEYKMEAASEKGRLINDCRWRLVRKYAPNGGKLFDLGCGDGAFIRAAPDGFDCVGYDPNPYSGYSVWRWNFVPSILTMWDVIEHLDVAFAPFHYWQPQPGLVFISTPNIDNAPDADILSWKHIKPGEHKYYFNLKSLAATLHCNGYMVLEWNFDEGVLRDPCNPDAIITVVGGRQIVCE